MKKFIKECVMTLVSYLMIAILHFPLVLAIAYFNVSGLMSIRDAIFIYLLSIMCFSFSFMLWAIMNRKIKNKDE